MGNENKYEKCCCTSAFLICVVLLLFLITVCIFAVFVVLKFDVIKTSYKLLAFLLASFGIMLICFSVLCVSALDIYMKCKKIAVLKELSFGYETTKKLDSNTTEITTKSLDKDKYKAFVNAVADL